MDLNLSLCSQPSTLLQLHRERNFNVSIILQLLDDEKYYDTKRTLEKESGVYFNLAHFNRAILSGDWNEAESYISAFIKVDDILFSAEILFEIRKNKFLEALHRGDRSTAMEILNKDLKYIQATDPTLFEELTLLIPLKNIWENPKLAYYTDTLSVRIMVSQNITNVIKNHPLLKDKLQMPRMDINTMRAIRDILKLDLRKVIRQ